MSDKIAFFLPYLAGGGAERVVLTIAGALSAEGVPVDLVLGSVTGPLVGELLPEVKVVDLHASRTFSAIVPLLCYLRRVRPAVLISTLNHVNVMALIAVALSRTGTRAVVREANTFSVDAHGILRWLVPIVYKLADGFVAVSAGVADDLIRTAGVPQRKVRVIYNPVISPSLIRLSEAECDHPWFQPGQPPVVLGVGRLSEQKDFATLLRAFAIARRTRPMRLVILGQGEQRSTLLNLADELDVAADFTLPGFLVNPFAYMRRAGVFVLSSAWEGLPNVLIQAMALGTPVVSTRCPSGPEEICDGVPAARLVPVGNVSEMARAICSALEIERPSAQPASLSRFELHTATRQYLEFARSLS